MRDGVLGIGDELLEAPPPGAAIERAQAPGSLPKVFWRSGEQWSASRAYAGWSASDEIVGRTFTTGGGGKRPIEAKSHPKVPSGVTFREIGREMPCACISIQKKKRSLARCRRERCGLLQRHSST